jgi:hypothetical protein
MKDKKTFLGDLGGFNVEQTNIFKPELPEENIFKPKPVEENIFDPMKKHVCAEFRDARDLLIGIEIAERQFKREQFKKCDWDDPEDVASYRKQTNIEWRNKFLDKKYPDRRCPCCGRIVLQTNRWVIDKNKRKGMCKSCFKRLANNKVPDTVQLFDHKLFAPERYSFDPQLLLQARELTGLSVREFSRIAGWGRTYQQKLENGEIKAISVETANVLICVLNDNKITTLDTKL